MKFVCDNCQAKYQIGDDKVAGKTVRMKCRKCGYNIKVSPTGPGEADAPAVDTPSHEPSAPQAPAPAPPTGAQPAVPAPAASHARQAWGGLEDESTAIMSGPTRDAVAAAIGAHDAPRAPAPAPRPGLGSLPTRPAPLAPRPVPAPAAPRPVTTGGAQRPASPARSITHDGGPAAKAPAPARPVSRQLAAQHDPTPHAAPHVAPAHHPAAPPSPELEWYVGIAGSPIGPVRVSVIRERAAAHEVDGDSLVWHEGMPEWRPLRTFPELFEVVTAAHAEVAAPAARAPVPIAAPAPAAPAPVPLAAAPIAAAPVAAAPIAAAPVAAAPIAAAPVAAAPIAAAPVAAAPAAAKPLHVVSDPFAAPINDSAPKAPASNGANGTNGKVNGIHLGLEALADAGPAPAPAAIGGGETAPSASSKAPAADAPAKLDRKPSNADVDSALEDALIPRRRGGATHPMAYAFIAAAMVFGGVAAYVLFIKPPPQPQIIVLPGNVVTTTATPTTSPDKAQGGDVGDPSTAPSGAAGRPQVGKPWPKASAAAAAPTGNSAPLDTSGFVSTVPGPSQGGPSGPSAGGGGQLQPNEIQAVVAQNQPLVKRKCWQPALEGRPPNGPTNAHVTGNLTIGASGNVESASASGAEKDFPGLAPCIAGRMKGWKFPPSSGSTPVNVPFSFFGQ